MAELRILIVGDRADVARELAARLAALGHDVAGVAASGGEAAPVAARTAPDLVLVDVAPGDGSKAVEAADAVRRHHAIPVLLLGAEADAAGPRRDGSEAEHGYLAPPFSDRELALGVELAVCRHGTERAVHEMEGFFAVSIDMFCFLDFSGYFRRLNPAWERTLGFTRAELMSRPFIEFVHPDDRERTLRQNAEVRGGRPALGFENRYLCKDGSHRWLRWNASSQFAQGVIYSVARDVTARKEAEEERARLVRTLEATLAEVRTLQEILPICMYCKKIRDDEDYWHTVETYILRHTSSRFSHGICPSCMETEVEPQLMDMGGP